MTTLLKQRNNVAIHLIAKSFSDLDGRPMSKDIVQVPYRPNEVIDEDLVLIRPRIMVLGVAYEETIATRNTKQRLLYIRCYIESMLEPRDSHAVDNMIHMVDQVQGVCSGMDNWIRTTPIIDEHNLPFMFHVLREKAFFQAIIHPTYLVTANRKRRS